MNDDRRRQVRPWCRMRWVLGAGAVFLASACSDDFTAIDVEDPARGPSEFLRNPEPVSDGQYTGGNDTIPAARADVAPAADPTLPLAAPPPCDGPCESFCAGAAFENPVNRGLCPTLWGVGIEPRPTDAAEACRRIYADTVGHFPGAAELSSCLTLPWQDTVSTLLQSEDFVDVQRRRWADKMRYDTQTVSVERIFDMDELVARLYRGELAYDNFAAIVSAHPVLTRRYATDGDRAEALLTTFLGRPPFEDERSDIGRLYRLWDNGYYDHPDLDMRLPDAVVRYRCVDENGKVDPQTSGECTSIKFGFTQVVLEPDARATRDEDGNLVMWSGLLSAAEWDVLQAPGRLLSEEWLFWEQAARDVIDQYLGYPLGNSAPEVTEQMVRYLLQYNGDIRSLHFAMLTSTAYLQSSTGDADTPLRFTYGPLKQADAEVWVDSLRHLVGEQRQRCDYRLNRPGEFLESGSVFALALINESDWELSSNGEGIRSGYRDLVRNLGGCPDNSQGGRFKIVSVLTTSTQLNVVGAVCDPGMSGERDAIDTAALLPAGMSPTLAVDANIATQIYEHQLQLFYGRAATEEERLDAAAAGEACQRSVCDAESFARPTCFAVLSSAEMLFY